MIDPILVKIFVLAVVYLALWLPWAAHYIATAPKRVMPVDHNDSRPVEVLR